MCITGASGFLGSAFASFLTTGGHAVRSVGRGPGNDVRWDPARGQLDATALEGSDAVLHLAGSTIAERWTAERRRAIRESRVQSTRRIAEACARMPQRPEVVICGSGVGMGQA